MRRRCAVLCSVPLLWLAATSAEEPRTLESRLVELSAPMHKETMARLDGLASAVEPADIEGLGRGLQQLGADYPLDEGTPLRNFAGEVFRFLSRHDATAAAHWRTALQDNRNAMLARFARGLDALERARTEPLQLEFTAVDGRKVDMENLRGKVVLIEFRGVTWCGACRQEEPYLKAAYAQLREHGLEILTITHESDRNSRQFVLDYVVARASVWR